MTTESSKTIKKTRPGSAAKRVSVFANVRWRMGALMFFADVTGFALAGIILLLANLSLKIFVLQFSDLRYAFIPVVCLLMFSSTKLYPGVGISPPEEIRLVAIYNTVSFVVGVFFVQLVEVNWSLNFLAVLPLGMMSVTLILLTRWSVRIIAVQARLWGVPVAILGRGKQVDHLTHYFLQRRRFGYIPVLLVTEKDDKQNNTNPLPIITMKRLFEDPPHPLIMGVDTILVDAAFFGGKLSGRFHNKLIEMFPKTIFVSDLTWLEGVSLQVHDFEGLAGIETVQNNLSPVNSALKRLIDIFGSLTGILILFPLLALVSILIKLDSPGPIIFSHPRIGRDGRKFQVYKFRTMMVDAEKVLKEYLEKNEEARQEWHHTHKLRHDPRITRLGNFLRKFSIDELPQLFNVLAGEMSLVGPRPLPDYHTLPSLHICKNCG